MIIYMKLKPVTFMTVGSHRRPTPVFYLISAIKTFILKLKKDGSRVIPRSVSQKARSDWLDVFLWHSDWLSL